MTLPPVTNIRQPAKVHVVEARVLIANTQAGGWRLAVTEHFVALPRVGDHIAISALGPDLYRVTAVVHTDGTPELLAVPDGATQDLFARVLASGTG